MHSHIGCISLSHCHSFWDVKQEIASGGSPLIKSHVSLSDCDEKSLHIIEQSPRELDLNKKNSEDGATLQL